jgi:tight adherence protein C
MALSSRILATHLPRPNKQALDLQSILGRLFSSGADRKQVDYELPDFAQALGLLLGNGLPVNVALGWLAPRSQGLVAKAFSQINDDLELGADLVQELQRLGKQIPNQQLVELCEKLSVAIVRGAPVSTQVIAHAGAARALLHRQLLKQAGSNETKMLIPVIFLILPVTVLFAIFPSMLVLAEQL